jgi:hypothetical protein
MVLVGIKSEKNIFLPGSKVGICKVAFFGPGPGLDSMSVKKCIMVKKVDKLSKNSDF